MQRGAPVAVLCVHIGVCIDEGADDGIARGVCSEMEGGGPMGSGGAKETARLIETHKFFGRRPIAAR